MLPANCCCCLLPLLVSAARGCCELLMAGAARFADCGSVGRTGALLGRLGALVHRLGVSGDRLAQSWGRPRPLSSRLRASGAGAQLIILPLFLPPLPPLLSPLPSLPPFLSSPFPPLPPSCPSSPPLPPRVGLARGIWNLAGARPSQAKRASTPCERRLGYQSCESVSGETGRKASRVFLFLAVRRLTAGKNTHPGAQR